MQTLGDFLLWAQNKFEEASLHYGHGTDNAWDEAVMLALYVLQLPAENDRSILELRLEDEHKNKLIGLAERRIRERIPIPYLTGEAWLAGERYFVNPDVLIPRSPLAELIGNEFQPWLGDTIPRKILDLCTGSACLAIYCSKIFPDCHIDALDISSKALLVAQQNIRLHACEQQVQLIESDLFSKVSEQRYDIIISNPPYVSAQSMAELPFEYRHEPSLGLASGEEGLDLTIKILKQASNYLAPNGLLIVEVGNSWHALVDKYPHVDFTWLEFAHGGEGVFLLSAGQLETFSGDLAS